MKHRIKDLRDKAKKSVNLEVLSIDSILNFNIPLPPISVQLETLAIFDEIDNTRKNLEGIILKAEQRAKYILDGYISSKPSSEPAQEIPVPVNEVIETPVAPVAPIAPVEPPKPKKTILKLKKKEPVA